MNNYHENWPQSYALNGSSPTKSLKNPPPVPCEAAPAAGCFPSDKQNKGNQEIDLTAQESNAGPATGHGDTTWTLTHLNLGY